MKRYVTIFMIVFILLATGTNIIAEESANKVTVTLDGTEVIFPDAQPFIDARNRTLVPIRFVSEAMGADVSWDDDTQTVTIIKKHDTITYKIGNLGATLNGVIMSFDTVGILKEDRTFVPIRFISELLNCKVEWVEETMTVVITSPPAPVKFPELKITVHFPDNEYTGKLFWITLDNLRDFSDCTNYQFKVDFVNPEEFNIVEQDEGAINGWQTIQLNQWRKITQSGASIFTVSSINYTTRKNMEIFKLYDGMPLEFVLTVKRNCSGEEKEYNYTETFKYPYPIK